AFHIASVSKTFTAMAILKLAEQEKLKLDDDVKLYFPNFPYDGITIRMMLTHRSGLPNYLYFMEKLGWDKKVARLLIILLMVKQFLMSILTIRLSIKVCFQIRILNLCLTIQKIHLSNTILFCIPVPISAN
ncbi:MAG: serine hydrolase domain-containing protein, partial [Flavobacterium sp.]